MMNEIQYTGEHLWVGNLGNFFIFLGLASIILSFWSYGIQMYSKEEKDKKGWMSLARTGFFIHGASILGLIGIVFYAMYNQMYEYSYVFDHVSPDLPMKYILSAFWEGQEGSFMLWMFWHVVLGAVFIKFQKDWESPVLFTIALAEILLMSMILGIYVPWIDGEFKIGSNPVMLLRQVNDAPIFNNADYLSLIKGRGLNPLLQNYWMTIHPPTLFLGFASTIIPFGFAVGGLWTNNHKDWLKPALSWSLFSAGILGTGILMGSFWAYEALSFGGYWNWDPVENASFVPWLTLIAGIHTHLVAKNTGYATRATYFFYLVSFLLILYSTFLTRSGILGDTSAHAFTEMGLEWQLIILMGVFALLGALLFIRRYSKITAPKQDESLYSREFWMFMGSLVLMFSALLITASTSLPVFNKIAEYFDPGFAGKVIKDQVSHYNKTQLWIGIFIALLSSASIFLRYSGKLWETQKRKFAYKLIIHSALAIILTAGLSAWVEVPFWPFALFGFAGFFSMTANADYLTTTIKGNFRLASSSMAHFGIGMMLVGLLTSGLNSKYISSNPFVFKGLFSDEDLEKYVQLIKGKPLISNGYMMTYQGDTLLGRERQYVINFKQMTDDLRVKKEFTLYPNAVYANDFSKVAAFNPDTRHEMFRDIFTCVVALPLALQDAAEAKKIEDSLKFESQTLFPNDTLFYKNFKLIAGSLNYAPKNAEFLKHAHDAGAGVLITAVDTEQDTFYSGEAALGLDGALLYTYPAVFEELGLRIKLDEGFAEEIFTPEERLSYKEFVFQQGDSIPFGKNILVLKGFEKDPEDKNYEPKQGDIALSAILEIIDEKGQVTESRPIYVIRDNTPMSIKNYIAVPGLHIRFSNIDPVAEKFSFKIAEDIRKDVNEFPVGIADGVPRTDYIILEAKIFPGINLFWGGTILMMLGLLMAWIYRARKLAGKVI